MESRPAVQLEGRAEPLGRGRLGAHRAIALEARPGTARVPRALHGDSDRPALAVARARKIQRFLSQPFFVAEVFTGSPGKYVSLKDTIKGFKMIVSGECDALPEQAFYMVGQIEEAFEKAKTLQ